MCKNVHTVASLEAPTCLMLGQMGTRPGGLVPYMIYDFWTDSDAHNRVITPGSAPVQPEGMHN